MRPTIIRLATLVLLLWALALHVGCASPDRNASTQSVTSNASPRATPPDISKAQDYVIYHSNIRLQRSEYGELTFSPLHLKAVGNIASITIGAPNVGSLTAEQRAHTAMKAALDIQKATGAEAVLLYLSLGEDLPKMSYSVAMVAYAPAGKDWNDGASVQVWDVEVADVQIESEAIKLAQQAKRSDSDVALPLPFISRKNFVPGVSHPAGGQRSLDAQLFELLSTLVVEGQKEHPHNVEAATDLIARGVNVNARDHGQTPLLRATQNGHPKVMRVLLDHGADVNAQDDDGRTALMIAAGLSDPDMVRLLLERGAKINLKDNDGFTAWSGSEMIGGSGDARHREMRRLLKRAGAK